MSNLVLQMQVQKMQRAYKIAFEGLLAVAPELELTQRAALDEDYMRRFFARVATNGFDNWDLGAVHFKITAASLGIVNSEKGWRDFLANKKAGSLL